MKKTDWMKVILILSLLGNVTLFMSYERFNRQQEVRNELLNAYIYRDLAQLEEIINYQLHNNWENVALVNQKLDDAIDSVILHIGMVRDKDKKEVLWNLHDYLKQFMFSDESVDVKLNDKQRADYIYLGERLRSRGWTFNVAYDTSWNVFKTKVQEIVTE